MQYSFAAGMHTGKTCQKSYTLSDIVYLDLECVDSDKHVFRKNIK